ncbi:MAG: CBS domain-containing protein [Deltaproteobacteria bacterium]|nr:CBS domain-containing protein [Deltaproteobacteria bacterium]
MENYTVKDLMVPISEYATVSEGATLFDAVLTLEKAQEEFQTSKYHHRALLILDSDNRVVGKLSQLGVLRAIEPKNEQLDKIEDIHRFGFSSTFINAMREQHRREGTTMEDFCSRAAKLRVEDFMQKPSEGEYVEENTSLDTAIHQLTTGLHLSLLVTREKEIVGILRMSDVFAAVFHAMNKYETNGINKDA